MSANNGAAMVYETEIVWVAGVELSTSPYTIF
jgi:hypothetical protein